MSDRSDISNMFHCKYIYIYITIRQHTVEIRKGDYITVVLTEECSLH